MEEELNLTAFLDVLMNLIVFVLVSGAGLVTWGAVSATVPASDLAHGRAAAAVPRVHLETAGMTLSLEGSEPEPVTLAELPARLSRVGGRRLVLDAAPDVTLEQVVETMDAARKAHFDEVTLAD